MAATDTTLLQFYKYISEKPYKLDEAKQMILDGAICPDEKYRTPLSPLSILVQNGLRELCELMLEKGADPNYGGRNGRFPLILAARVPGETGDRIMKLLIDKGADINFKFMTGNTAFLEAAKENDLSKVKMLLECGADVNACNNSGDSALCVAALYGHLTMAKKLINVGCNLQSDRNNNKWKKIMSGLSPLHYTAYGVRGGHPNMALLLLKHGANVDVKHPENGRTPLHLCAIKNATLTANVLIEHGCQIDPVSTDNNELKTPLHKAIDSDHVEMVLELIKSGADLNVTAQHNMTPLMLALVSHIKHKREIVVALVKGGCDINMRATKGASHFSIALELDKHSAEIVDSFGRGNCIPYCVMFILSGCILDDEEKENVKQYFQTSNINFEYICEVLDSPWNLQMICRQTIRKQIGKSVTKKICTLDLPHKLKDYLNLCDIVNGEE